MMTPIRVLIVDDQRLMRDGLRALLEIQKGLCVVGEAGDGVDALAQVEALDPDVVLMDVRMPRMDGVETTRTLKTRGARARVLILTTFDDDQYVFAALQAGASGYVLKNLPAAELAAAIHNVHHGGVQLDPSVASKVVAQLARLQAMPEPASEALPTPPQPIDDLTPREHDVLRLLATGSSNREIGARLFISEGTVKNHVASILSRLGLRDRVQAALYAREHGLL